VPCRVCRTWLQLRRREDGAQQSEQSLGVSAEPPPELRIDSHWLRSDAAVNAATAMDAAELRLPTDAAAKPVMAAAEATGCARAPSQDGPVAQVLADTVSALQHAEAAGVSHRTRAVSWRVPPQAGLQRALNRRRKESARGSQPKVHMARASGAAGPSRPRQLSVKPEALEQPSGMGRNAGIGGRSAGDAGHDNEGQPSVQCQVIRATAVHCNHILHRFSHGADHDPGLPM